MAAPSSGTPTGPFIPEIKGDVIASFGSFQVGGVEFAITSTILSTWIVMVVLFVVVAILYAARNQQASRTKAFAMDLIGRMYAYADEIIGARQHTSQFLFLLGSAAIFVFMGNIVGLFLDWINLIIPAAHYYFRPTNSDFGSTAAVAILMILALQLISIRSKGLFGYLKHFLWNAQGDTIVEKGVNIFIGYVHLIGEGTRVASLALRLFLNIFIGVILISVFVYIGGLIPSGGTNIFSIITLPFWFFELFVAGLQTYIFFTLTSMYTREALEHHDHSEHHDTSVAHS